LASSYLVCEVERVKATRLDITGAVLARSNHVELIDCHHVVGVGVDDSWKASAAAVSWPLAAGVIGSSAAC
jgi:hypothetical protein